MIVGFVIWSMVFLVLLGIGIWAWRSDKAVGFYEKLSQFFSSASDFFSQVKALFGK